MLSFIIKGIFRDRSRYLFPILIISAGVSLMTFFLTFMEGYKDGMLRQNARFETGHVKIVTKAYSELLSQKPYDLGFLDIGDQLQQWQADFPELEWVQRISFGAILDKSDSFGNSLQQGQVMGFALDLLSDTREIQNLKLDKSLVRGRLPRQSGEILLSDRAFQAMQLSLGDSLMLMSSTVDGSMAFALARIAGTVNFGYEALDRGGIITDLQDTRAFLGMENGCSEILGFFRDGSYNETRAQQVKQLFNTRYSNQDEYSPLLLALSDQNNLGYMIGIMNFTFMMMAIVFVLILGIVLWNSGLMSGIRRYGEFGIRLALGEHQKQIYLSLLGEAVCIGLTGSILGLILGFLYSYPLSIWGLDLSQYGKTTSIIAENVIHTKLSPELFVIAFIPGLLSSLLGTALAGSVIFKRHTSQLFKEMEQ